MTTYTREDAIKWLIENDIDDFQQMFSNNDFTYASGILAEGFKGYNKFTKQELTQEIQQRLFEEEVTVL